MRNTLGRRGVVIILALIAALFVLALVLGGRAAGDGEAFAGSDGAATAQLEEAGHSPWFEPIFAPAGEVESGLFAMQAGLGGLALGYVVGRLRGRALDREQA